MAKREFFKSVTSVIHASSTIYDVLSAVWSRQGDVHLARTDDDDYPRNGGGRNRGLDLAIQTNDHVALTSLAVGDEVTALAAIYYGVAAASGDICTLTLDRAVVMPGSGSGGSAGVAEPDSGTINFSAVLDDGDAGDVVPWTIVISTPV